MDELWIAGAREVTIATAGSLLSAGKSLASVVVFVVDPREALGFDIAVGLLVRGGRPRAEAEQVVREQRAKMVAATGIAVWAGLLSLSEAASLLTEVGDKAGLDASAHDRAAQAFVDDELGPSNVRMIAARDAEWRLEQVTL